jgi:membrane-associated phospholipid phosphatase
MKNPANGWSAPMKAHDPEKFLSLEEGLTIGMAMLSNLLILIFMHIRQAHDIFVLNMLITAAILLAAYVHRRFPYTLLQFLRDWYVLPFLIVIYLENRTLIPLINPHAMDSFIMAADRFLFLGHDPTVLMERIMYPALSEILQLSYASFYFLPLSLCVILYFFRETRNDFHIAASTIFMGFYLSYIGYYFTPVLGPRFTMEHLQSVSLSGLWTFDLLRNLLAQAEGRMYDCMPSGHALVSLLTVLLSWRYAKSFFPVALVWAVLLIFSTVYLRYHYVTDLVVGISLGFAVYRWGEPMARRIITRNSWT